LIATLGTSFGVWADTTKGKQSVNIIKKRVVAFIFLLFLLNN
jgi:hypothetical protein